MVRLRFNRDILLVFASVLVQLPLAVFLGHYYDQRIFLETGYLVNSGLNPYQPHPITVFSNPHLAGLNPVVGYPPPWPLLLGLIYRLTYNFTPNLFLYNFASKIPIIIGNIALAYATKTIMQHQNMSPQTVRFAWLFLLFNPFTLLTTTAWGQFDTLTAVLCVAALYLLSKGMTAKSTLLLAVSFVLKPISFPLLGLPLLYSAPKNRRKNLVALLIIAVTVLMLWFLPFYAAGWAMPSSSANVTSYFRMAGGMTLFSVIDVFWRTADLPSGLWFLGYLWIPALTAGYIWVYRNPPKTMIALAKCAVVLLLLFFLSRTWLSEQNINLLLPFLLILMGSGTISSRTFHLAWIIPLVFLLLNASVPQLLFLVYPPIIPLKEAFDAAFGTTRLAARFAVTILWFIFASSVLYKIMSNNNCRFHRKSLNPAPPLTT
jgi:hypothetical protein